MKPFSLISLILILLSCNNGSTENDVTEWIAESAIPIKTVEAGNGFEDLLAISV